VADPEVEVDGYTGMKRVEERVPKAPSTSGIFRTQSRETKSTPSLPMLCTQFGERLVRSHCAGKFTQSAASNFAK
jgi:hypothetical protein